MGIAVLVSYLLASERTDYRITTELPPLPVLKSPHVQAIKMPLSLTK